MLRRSVLCLSVILLVSSIVCAATPDFSGKWVINKEKSEFRMGPDGPTPDVTLSVEQAADSIKVNQKFVGEHEFEQAYSLKINGVTQEIQGFGNQPAKASARWDASVLVIDMTQEFGGGDTQGTFKANERWELSADGKTLTIFTKINGPMGEMSAKRVMEKQ